MSSCRKCRNNQKGCCSDELCVRRERSQLRRDSVPDGVDRIGALPDDLILYILARIGCARAAAHASLLARRWRGLWALLPELAFHHVTADEIDAAFATFARRSLSLLQIRVPCRCHDVTIDSPRVSAWMRAAARVAPAKFIISDDVVVRKDGSAVELPCFDRTTAITLEVLGARFVLAPAAAGDLRLLESLSLLNCHVEGLGDLLRRCPRLRKLRITRWKHELKVHSPSLEELDVEVYLHDVKTRLVDIEAPVLKKLRFASGPRPCKWSGANEFTLSYSAPMMENLHWRCFCSSKTDRFGVRWRLFHLTLKTANPLGQMHLHHRHEDGNEDQDFGQFKIIPVTNFQVLELRIKTEGHVYGAMVLHLLGLGKFIRRLRLELHQERYECSVSCPCDHPSDWRSQTISLTGLKEVEIHGFNAKGHEITLLKVIFRSATMLVRTDVYFSNMVPSSNNRCKEIYDIAEAYPSMECNVYHDSAE
ncbi:hypothetical protein EJB05_12630, partial [Eragrostis curvula]